MNEIRNFLIERCNYIKELKCSYIIHLNEKEKKYIIELFTNVKDNSLINKFITKIYMEFYDNFTDYQLHFISTDNSHFSKYTTDEHVKVLKKHINQRKANNDINLEYDIDQSFNNKNFPFISSILSLANDSTKSHYSIDIFKDNNEKKDEWLLNQNEHLNHSNYSQSTKELNLDNNLLTSILTTTENIIKKDDLNDLQNAYDKKHYYYHEEHYVASTYTH